MGLVHVIPQVQPKPESASLFERLFGGREALDVKHPALGSAENTDDPFVSPDFGVLQGALRLTEPDLIDLINGSLTETTIRNGSFTHDTLSLLYRRALLARKTGLTIKELDQALRILNLSLEHSR